VATSAKGRTDGDSYRFKRKKKKKASPGKKRGLLESGMQTPKASGISPKTGGGELTTKMEG